MRMQAHGEEGQAPQPYADATDLRMLRMPAPLHGRNSPQKQDLSAQDHPRSGLHLQPRSLAHRDATDHPSPGPHRHSGAHDKLVARGASPAHDLRASAKKLPLSLL